MPSQEHEQFVAMIQSSPSGETTLEESRANFDAMMSAVPLAEDVIVEETTIAGVIADWVSVAESQHTRAVLYLHGGAYSVGSNVSHREFASRIARATQAKVLVLNYSLAPEHPYPIAMNESIAAYETLLNTGFASGNLLIAGDSAGGGLAIGTLLSLRDREIALPAGAICFSPWVDLECTGNSAAEDAVDDPLLTREQLVGAGQLYAPNSTTNTYASPVHADLSNLPPLLVFVGTREVLLSDSKRLAESAKNKGVKVDLVIEDGLVHVWQIFPIPEAAASLERVNTFANDVLKG